MPIYEKASEEIHERVIELRDKFHPGLRDSRVTLDVVMAHAKRDDNGDPVGPALKLHGYSCYAVVRILSLKDRAMGRADAEITLDGDQWDTHGSQM